VFCFGFGFGFEFFNFRFPLFLFRVSFESFREFGFSRSDQFSPLSDSLLIMPIQRLPRYVMLLQELKSFTPPSAPHFPELSAVHKAMADVATDGMRCED
jgi:hypothetical protein